MMEGFTMYRVCVKFKPENGWRSHIREFSDFAEIEDFLNEKWAEWPISVAYVFEGERFVTKYLFSPEKCARMSAAWQARQDKARRLMGNYRWG